MISLGDKCRDEPEIRHRISILEFINSLLPLERKVKIPSLVTNTCTDNLLSFSRCSFIATNIWSVVGGACNR